MKEKIQENIRENEDIFYRLYKDHSELFIVTEKVEGECPHSDLCTGETDHHSFLVDARSLFDIKTRFPEKEIIRIEHVVDLK